MSQQLPPLANLFAFASLDREALDETARFMEASGRFHEIWRPHPHWIAASSPLPCSQADSGEVRQAGYAFAEGRDRVLGSVRVRIEDRLERLAGVLEDGERRLASIGGDFGFIRFNPDGSATVVRSCGGLVPFYLWSGRESAAIGTLLTDHARYLPGEMKIDPLVHAAWISSLGTSPDHRTFVSGVRLLPRGHVATVSTAERRWSRYWDPRHDSLSPPNEELAREHVTRLRTLLVDRLAEDLDTEGCNLLNLSGGVDSSSLAALSARALGRPVATLSNVSPHEPERSRDLAYIEPLVAELGIRRHWVRSRSHELHLEYVARAPEAVTYVHHPLICLLPEVLAEANDIRVVFGGEFGDEVCGSSRLTIHDWDFDTSFTRLVRTWPNGPHHRRSYPLRWLDSRLRDVVRRPLLFYPSATRELVHEQLRDEYAEWWSRQRREYARDRRSRRTLAWRLNSGQSWVEMNWEAASLLGVRRSLPFVTRDILELAFSCHPSELIGPARTTKKLLRAALHDDVPHRNLYRLDRGQVLAESDSLPWRKALPERLGEVVRPDWIPTPPAELDPLDCISLSALLRTCSTFDRLRSERTSQRPPRGDRAAPPLESSRR